MNALQTTASKIVFVIVLALMLAGSVHAAPAPTISGVSPTSNTAINSITTASDVSYTVDQDLTSGSITMTRTGGTADAGSPHVCTLKGTALNSGAHNNIDLSDTTNSCTVAQSLVNGAIYTFVFAGSNAKTAGPVTRTSVTFDNTVPSGGSISYTDGYYNTASVPITYSTGSDAGAGLNLTSGRIQRASAILTGLSCGSFGSFSNLVSETDGSYTDTSVTSGNCYKYQYVIADNAGNQATYTSANVAKIAVCGDGTVNGAEACDGGLCCDAVTCQYKSAATECRASAGVCDIPETCTGTGAACPTDGFLSNANACRAAVGVCDATDYCSGSEATCPTDQKSPDTTVCRPDTGICDIAEFCTGTTDNCPADNYQSAITVCRASAGDCDLAETCTGSSAPCPANAYAPSTTVCRVAAGVCDLAESCTGSSAPCPANAYAPSTTVCRASAGVCDLAESCTGSSAPCPADAKSTAQCRAGDGACDVAENCDGINNICPTDAVRENGYVCAVESAQCDADDTCNGATKVCNENYAPLGATCDDGNFCSSEDQCDGSGACIQKTAMDCSGKNRAAINTCTNDPDANQYTRDTRDAFTSICDETNNMCPEGDLTIDHQAPTIGTCDVNCLVDNDCNNLDTLCADGVCNLNTYTCEQQFKSATTECRPSTGACDVAEQCTGASAECPTDGFAPDTVECRPALGVCDLSEMCTGSGARCPSDAKSTAVCRPSAGDCDIAESCDGVNDVCPTDAVQPADTVCVVESGVCDANDVCDGQTVICNEKYAPVDTSCSDGNVCNGAETCDGSGFCQAGTSVDTDKDGVSDVCDNCANAANADQKNSDGDLFGDVCDNCASTANNDQADSDADGVGDVCDNCVSVTNPDQTDVDLDTVGNACDNCPSVANVNQMDTDADKIGDVCDICPVNNPNPQNYGDVCNSAPNACGQTGSGTIQCDGTCSAVTPTATDTDSDGIPNCNDNCVDVSNANQADLDQDGIGDACDPQTCGNGIPEGNEQCDSSAPAGYLCTDCALVCDESQTQTICHLPPGNPENKQTLDVPICDVEDHLSHGDSLGACPVCGDGNVDQGEQCDDGNTANGDGCDAQCQVEQQGECTEGTVFTSCDGTTPSACGTYGSEDACGDAGCDWTTTTSTVTKWSESFATSSDWLYGSAFSSHHDSSDCINDANDKCLKVKDGCSDGSTATKKTNLDLSACTLGSATFHIAKVKESGDLESNDCIYVSFSANGGSAWGSKTQIFCDDNPASTFSMAIPDTYLTSQMRLRIEKMKFDGHDESAYLDGFSITCDVKGESVCQGDPDACDTYTSEQSCTAAGCDATCRARTYCGDGAVQNPNDEQVAEQCDENGNNGQVCTPDYGSTCDWCDQSCVSHTEKGQFCGDQVKNGAEQCDGTDGVGPHQACNVDCHLVDLTYCGDGTVQNPNDEQVAEQCDADGQNGVPCTPTYGESCNWCDQSCISHTETGQYCGDNLLNDGETCDGTAVPLGEHQTCEQCQIVDHPYCGDGTVNQQSEECDGTEGVTQGYRCTQGCTLELINTCDAGVNLVANGGFESPVVESTALWDIFPDRTSGLFWDVAWATSEPSYQGHDRPAVANIELHRGVLGPAAEGAQYAELDSDWNDHIGTLDGEPASTILSEELATVPGAEYTISFAFSPRPGTDNSQNVLELYWDGNLVDTISAANAGGTTAWTTHTYKLTATGTETTIKFRDAGVSDSLGTFLDNVGVECVPPPAPYCGDGNVDQGEECDGSDLDDTACTDLQFDGGTLACTPNCVFDTTGCFNEPEPYCGDGVVNQQSEECDADGQNGVVCTPAYGDDCTYCSGQCQDVVVNGPYCGDNIVDQGFEQCDGSAPEGYTCLKDCTLVQCEIGTTVVSDTSTTVEGDGDATATWTHPAWTAGIPGATWIWNSLYVAEPRNGEVHNFTKTVTIPGAVLSATLDVAADNTYKVWINGIQVAADANENNFATADTYDVTGDLTTGENTLVFQVTNLAWDTDDPQVNPAGLLYRLIVNSDICVEPVCGDGVVNQESEECDGSAPEGFVCSDCKLQMTCEYAKSHGLLRASLDGGSAFVTNDANESFTVSLASYEMYAALIEDQLLFDSMTKSVEGQSTDLFTVKLPDCAYQLELVCGEPLSQNPNYGDRVINFTFGEDPFCTPHPREGDSSVDVTVADSFPQNSSYVFLCDVEGFTPTNYYWYFGDGEIQPNSTNQNVFHNYLANGDYTVACTATNGTVWQTGTLGVAVSSYPAPQPEASVAVTVAEYYPKNSSYVFYCTATGFSPTGYDWEFDDGQFLYDLVPNNVYHTFTENGDYTVTCTASDGSTTRSGWLDVSVDICTEYALSITGVEPDPAAPDSSVDVSGTLYEVADPGATVSGPNVLVNGQEAPVLLNQWMVTLPTPESLGWLGITAEYVNVCGKRFSATDGVEVAEQSEESPPPLEAFVETVGHGGVDLSMPQPPAETPLLSPGTGGHGGVDLSAATGGTGEESGGAPSEPAAENLLTGAATGSAGLAGTVWFWLLLLLIVLLLGGYWTYRRLR